MLRALPRSHSCLDADCRSASPRPSKLVVLLLTTAFLPSTRLWVKMREARRWYTNRKQNSSLTNSVCLLLSTLCFNQDGLSDELHRARVSCSLQIQLGTTALGSYARWQVANAGRQRSSR